MAEISNEVQARGSLVEKKSAPEETSDASKAIKEEG
jgi:hypothetical protein